VNKLEIELLINIDHTTITSLPSLIYRFFLEKNSVCFWNKGQNPLQGGASAQRGKASGTLWILSVVEWVLFNETGYQFTIFCKIQF
jgi:hypothetical protein